MLRLFDSRLLHLGLQTGERQSPVDCLRRLIQILFVGQPGVEFPVEMFTPPFPDVRVDGLTVSPVKRISETLEGPVGLPSLLSGGGAKSVAATDAGNVAAAFTNAS